MHQKFNLKLEVFDHDGSLVPCNQDQEFSAYQRAVTCWLALDLLFDGAARDEQITTFVSAIRRYGDGVEGLFSKSIPAQSDATIYSIKKFKLEYDQLIGNALAFETDKLFRHEGEKLTLYKICRWAARCGTGNHERRRAVLLNLRHDMGVQRDHRTLLISTAIEQRLNKVVLTNIKKSLCPTVALAMKILYADDKQFTEYERVALHRVMLNLGVKPTDVKGLTAAFNGTVSSLVQQIDPADHEEALLVALEMAILDHKISPSERRIIDDVLAQMGLTHEQMERIRLKTELDTGVYLRFEQNISIDYGSLKKLGKIS